MRAAPCFRSLRESRVRRPRVSSLLGVFVGSFCSDLGSGSSAWGVGGDSHGGCEAQLGVAVRSAAFPESVRAMGCFRLLLPRHVCVEVGNSLPCVSGFPLADLVSCQQR